MINRRTWRHLIRIWQSPLAGLTQATAVLACDWDIFTVTCFLVDVVLTHSKIGLAVLALVRGIFRVTGLVEAALQGRAGMGAHGHFHGHLLAAGDASPLHDRTGTLSSSRPAQCHAPELPHQARALQATTGHGSTGLDYMIAVQNLFGSSSVWCGGEAELEMDWT